MTGILSVNLLRQDKPAQTYNCGKLGLTNGSFSAPLTALFFLCLGSELAEGACELFVDGGFRFAKSFLCLSISSLC